MKPEVDHVARFETVGELYYRHSGRLRPGKYEAPETGRDSLDPENKAAFDEWMATRCFGAALDRIAELVAKVEDLEGEIDALRERDE